MEDMTDEQVMELIQEKYPENPDEVFQAFKQMQAEAGTSNYETVLLITRLMKQDKQNADRGNTAEGIAGRGAKSEQPQELDMDLIKRLMNGESK